MPLLTLHDAWVYWLIAAVGFVLLFVFCEFVFFLSIPGLWIAVIYNKKSSLRPLPWYQRTPRLAFNLISFVVYLVAVALDQFGYAFAWYAIVAATDIFVSAFNLLDKDIASGRLDMPPPNMQAG